MDEQLLEQQIKKLRELQKETEKLEMEAQTIMDALGVTREEIDHLFSNPENLLLAKWI